MTDKEIIQELAKKYMELACSPEQEDTNARVRATNDLKVVRPPVMIEEIPWYQMDMTENSNASARIPGPAGRRRCCVRASTAASIFRPTRS